MRRFTLFRREDFTGFSGTGTVAEGVQFSDGRCTMRWCAQGKPRSTVDWDSVEELIEVHGHDGATVLVWVDQTRRGAIESSAAEILEQLRSAALTMGLPPDRVDQLYRTGLARHGIDLPAEQARGAVCVPGVGWTTGGGVVTPGNE